MVDLPVFRTAQMHNIGSAEALPILCVRCARWERERERERDTERERERERRKWRHHCRAKIGDKFTLSVAKNSHLAMSWDFPLPKIRTFRFSLHTSHLTLLKWSPLWRWNSQWVLTFRCQKNSPSLFRLSQVARLFFPSRKWIKLIPKTIGNRKRDCAWGCARGINTTWENLQIEKHKSGRRSFRSPYRFVLCDLQIFSGGVYPPSATSRTISFSISNRFWS